MPLPPHEKLRLQRERLFQKRVLASVERPAGPRFVRVINSRLFIWFLSVVFLSLAGGYFAHYQQCSREADRLKDQFYRLTSEIFLRQENIAFAVERAATLDEVRVSLKTLPSIYADMRDRSLRELSREFRRVAAQMEKTVEMAALIKKATDLTNYSAHEITAYSGISMGQLPLSLTDRELPALKDFVRRRSRSYKSDYTLANMTVLTTNCSVPSIIELARGKPAKLLNARPLFIPNEDWEAVMERF